ncbi:nuclear transport factor 2 family protein [Anaerocolumna xylanovorans]|uniref:SnoaL-like domain-containing protein n=1 Tax=Anaerocolumna xylanovorans DSM 12503 TaxID=1121345 RepID=A0A1M7Y025_9FIRM|nr:nuclear transport factor 2 family protein [Anaerocolumna xylanovorans]SHO44728.1 SnoaL-like domain-containing protein [Anaerocolumna xylanovorans DSM 12503]
MKKTNKNYQLPEAVETHFRAANTGDPIAFLSAFHEDAVVIDAGKEYRGKTAIKIWSEKTYFGDHLQLEITNVIQDAVEFVITAIADGDYDKTGVPDPLYLDFHFVVENDKVKLLRIVLSSNSRAVPLPSSVAAFYHASDVYDGTLLAGCFSEDAVLQDEGMEFREPEVISEHILKANRDAKVTMDITNCSERDNEAIVTATLTGEFEGSPLPLDFHFTLDNEKIKVLNITLTGE